MLKKSIILLVIVVLVGCSSKNEKANSSSLDVVSMGLGMTDETSLNEKQFTYILRSNQDFTPAIEIVNDFPHKNTYKMYVLLDSKKIDFIYNQTKMKDIDVDLNAGERRKFNIKIPKVQDGIHDLVVFLVRNENKSLTKPEYVPPEEKYVVRRSKLIVNSEKPYVDSYKNTNYQLTSTKVTDDLIIVSKEKTGDLRKALSIVNRKDLNTLWVNVPVVNSNQKFSWFVFINGKQIETKGNYIEPISKGVISFPLNLHDLDIDSPSTLVLGIIDNPTENIETSEGESNLGKVPLGVHFSNPITINK